MRKPPAKVLYMDIAKADFLRIWPASDPNRLEPRYLHNFVVNNYQETVRFRNLHIYTPKALARNARR